MLKSIPKSNISKKKFPVYKEWIQTTSDSPILELENESGAFYSETANISDGVYTSPLYNSIQSKYYTSNGNVFIQYGIVRNPGNFSYERVYADTIYVIRIPRNKYGEQIKKGSIVFEDLDNGVTYVDDGFGSITTEQPMYNFVSYDVDTQIIIFQNNDGEQFDITLSSLDLNTGIGVFTYGGDTDNYVVLQIDFQSGNIRFSQELDLDGFDPDFSRIGNVFYDDGLIVLTNTLSLVNYSITYKSTQTIHETEVLISIEKGEFNTSQNPSAIDISLFQEYDFDTTAIVNSKPAGTVTIREVNDISKQKYYMGTVGSSSGSWDDYSESGSADPTGSYLAPYITTIGMYDNDNNMVAVAKLPKPIKNLPDYSINFIVRFDT